MPTQRFYHLKEEKRSIIKKAAIEECARAPYEEISINKIIKAADISRGSFYTYFEDKDDMIRFLLEDLRDDCIEYMYKQIRRSGGDIIMTIETIAVDLMEHGMEYPNAQLYRNLLLNIGLDRNMKTFSIHPFIYDDPEYQAFISQCYKLHDPEKCPFRDEWQLSYVMELLLLEMVRYVAMYHMIDEAAREKIRRIMHERLEIIRRGLQ